MDPSHTHTHTLSDSHEYLNTALAEALHLHGDKLLSQQAGVKLLKEGKSKKVKSYLAAHVGKKLRGNSLFIPIRFLF